MHPPSQTYHLTYTDSQLQDAIFSHLMYPQVFSDFLAFRAKYDNLGVLPTPAFFYGLQPGEEIEIYPGKILIIKLISIAEGLVKKGEQVDSDDLLVRIETA